LGKIIAHILRVKEFLNPETLKRNDHYSLCNEPEERSSLLGSGGSMKPHIVPELTEFDIFKLLFRVVFELVQTSL